MANHDECTEIVRQLWPYLDGALPEALQERVVAHLERCTNCRSHFDFEREFLSAVCVHGAAGSDGEFEPLRARVLAALADEGMKAG